MKPGTLPVESLDAMQLENSVEGIADVAYDHDVTHLLKHENWERYLL